MGEWLIPWRERGRSGPVRDNFLWKHGRLYIMDNHRLALWCWWQHLNEDRQWNYTHIDRHFDSLWQTIQPWHQHTLPAHRTELAAFREAKFQPEGNETWTFELYRWDIITSALWALDADRLREVYFATDGEGDYPLIPRAQHLSPWKVPGHLAYLILEDRVMAPANIIDIDIDYFTRSDFGGELFGRVFSDEYVRDIGTSLANALSADRDDVVTIALSPSTTGSWPLAERVLAALLAPMPDILSEFLAGAPPAGSGSVP
jgi:hypothetical protein